MQSAKSTLKSDNLNVALTKNENQSTASSIVQPTSIQQDTSTQSIDTSKYYSMINPSLLIKDIIELPEYKTPRDLLEKIKSGNIDNITRLEELGFKDYLKKQLMIFKELKIKSKFILTIYIMFYSKYHLTHNFKYYYWENSKIMIPSWKEFNKMTKYYLKINDITFLKYVGWINFINSSKKSSDIKIFYSEDFSNTVQNLKNLDKMFTDKSNNIDLYKFRSLKRKGYETEYDEDEYEYEDTYKKIPRKKKKIESKYDENEVNHLIDSALNLIKTKKNYDELNSLHLIRDNVLRRINVILEKEVLTNLVINKK